MPYPVVKFDEKHDGDIVEPLYDQRFSSQVQILSKNGSQNRQKWFYLDFDGGFESHPLLNTISF